jgi:hypothetical protein
MPRLEHARRIIYQLGNDGFTPEQIGKFAADEMADKLVVPGLARDSVAFIHAVNELAHIKYALSLPDKECLEMLAGGLAVTGKDVSEAHKQRAKDKDISAFQKEAAPLFEANDYNITRTLQEPSLAAYVKRHYGEHTLRDALKKIKPEGMGPKGRPKKR